MVTTIKQITARLNRPFLLTRALGIGGTKPGGTSINQGAKEDQIEQETHPTGQLIPVKAYGGWCG